MKSSKGFSLIEMLIVVAFIAIISALSIANYRQGERSRRTAIAADTATNALRNAQNFALTSRQILDSNCVLGKAPQAYLVFFTEDEEIELYGVDKCDEAILIEDYSYPLNVRVQNNGYKVNAVSAQALQFRFTTPFAQATVSTDETSVNNGPFSDFTSADITIESTSADFPRTVTVDGVSGRIGE